MKIGNGVWTVSTGLILVFQAVGEDPSIKVPAKDCASFLTNFIPRSQPVDPPAMGLEGRPHSFGGAQTGHLGTQHNSRKCA